MRKVYCFFDFAKFCSEYCVCTVVSCGEFEIVPFTYEGGIDAFMKNEVLSYAPDAYVDEKKTVIGYEISFTKYFYKPVELREMSDILESLKALEKEADGVLAEIMEGL